MVRTGRNHRFNFGFLARFYPFPWKRLGFEKITEDILEVLFVELRIVNHGNMLGCILEGDGWATIPQLPDYKSGALPT
jgi:hypothetical protein